MRPAWRLAINSLSARRSRTVLLAMTVALSSALIVAVACSMSSLQGGLRDRVRETVGEADVTIAKPGARPFEVSVLEDARGWEGVELAVGRWRGGMGLSNERTGEEFGVSAYGVDVGWEFRLRPLDLIDGRLIERDGEVNIDTKCAEELDAVVGDVVSVTKFGEPMTLEVVGIVRERTLGESRGAAYVTLETLARAMDRGVRLSEIQVVLEEGVDAEAFVEARSGLREMGIVPRTTARVTSGLEDNLKSSQVGLVIASALAFMAAAFIIMTGLSTNVQERERELAVLRCIGGTRVQLGVAQLLIGLLIGGMGALVGFPAGVAGAAVLVGSFPEQLPGGFVMSWFGSGIGVVGAVVAGVLGALWPAWKASRTSPLSALSVRARKPSRRGVALASAFGLLGAATHVSVFLVLGGLSDRLGGSYQDVLFWSDVLVGVPSGFAGYFLLSVPTVVAVVHVFEGLVRRVFGLPAGVLGRQVLATPYRHGFTAGAMMLGLALLVGIWTNGNAVMRDWLGKLEFPDAFAYGIGNMDERTLEAIGQIEGVARDENGDALICPLTLQSLQTGAFGVSSLQTYATSFVAFEPREFFAMMELTWVEGDRASAMEALERGNAVLVANEFRVARGIGVGDTIELGWDGKVHEFAVVGVVNSPGLDVASQFFNFGDDYLENAVNAVFGSRADLKRIFGNDTVDFVQIDAVEGYDDERLLGDLQKIPGVLLAGTGRQIKDEIRSFMGRTMLVFSTVALAAMLVACFGVANLIVAGIQARRFEFGVLRSIGATRGQVVRLVMGEAVIISIAASVLGTLMGVQIAWGGQQMNEAVIGLDLDLHVPVVPVVVGWGIVSAITLGAAFPAVWALGRKKPRELLGAVRG